jgi:hypothetical protein
MSVVSTAALRCDDCGEILTATIKGQHEQQVRHTREQTVLSIELDAEALGAAVSQHRARGCPARHFTQVELTDSEA